MEDLVFPKQVKVEELTDTSGRLVIEPLERGFGTTLGNSIRRVLLSAIPGAAVVRVRFTGKYHEYDTIEGVKEDVIEIILNLKGIAFRLHDGELKRLTLEKKGPGEVTAADITLQPGIEVINPDHHIATLNAKGALDLEMEVEAGFGYVPAEMNRLEDSPLSVIPIDADFSPVRKVNFVIEETRVTAGSGPRRRSPRRPGCCSVISLCSRTSPSTRSGWRPRRKRGRRRASCRSLFPSLGSINAPVTSSMKRI